MKRPLAGVAAWYAAGILAGAYVEPSLPWLFAATLVCAGLAMPTWRGTIPALAACLLFAGWTNLVSRTAVLAPDDLRRIATGTEELATLRGTLEATPEIRLQSRNGRLSTNCLAVLRCQTLERPGEDSRAVSGRVLVSTPIAPGPEFTGGAAVELAGVLQPPRGPLAPEVFDFAQYLHWRGIEFELRLAEAGDWRWAPGATPPAVPWADRFQRWAKHVLAYGLNESEEEVPLLWAMTLGWKTALTDEVQEAFMRSGTMHIFAISGLHIALIAALIGQVLRLLLLPRTVVGGVILVLCWAYTLATGVQPSAVRSTLMTTFVVGGWMLARPLNLLNSLAAAAVAVLVWDPRQLFQAGFQLSFTVVAAIGLLASPLRARLIRPFEPDPMLPESEISKPRRWLLDRWGEVAGHVAVAVASWLGSLPLAANLFHLATPGSLVANLVVVPLSSLALGCNVASLACGTWASGLGELFNHSAWFWMRGMLVTSRWAASLPGGCWNIASQPLTWIAGWYLVLTATGLRWWHLPHGRRILTAVVAGLVLAGFLEARARHDPLRIVVIPLAGGHAVWVRHAQGTSLIDTGDLPSSEAVVAPFLKAQGINRLDRLALSHGDIRHIGGATNIVARFPPRAVWLSPLRFRSAAYRAIIDAGAPRPIRNKREVSDGDEVPPWRVVHPRGADAFPRADDGCLTLALEEAGARVLLLADLDRRGQAVLLDRHPELVTDVLILGPAAGGAPLLEALLDQLNPRLVVVADALHPATARARPEFRAALAGRSCEVLYTSETGSVDLRWDGAGWRVLNARGERLPHLPTQLRTKPGSLPVTR